MRVSVRLKGLWASALVASLAVAPSLAFGQNEFVPPTATNQTSANASTMQTSSAEATAEAKRLLLKARQALANGDLQTSRSMAEAANKLPVDFQSIGDSPATVVSLIDRRDQLVAMEKAQDPNYNLATASYFLVQAESLIHYQDFDNAKQLIKHARAFPVQFDANTGSPDQLEQLLKTRQAAVASTPSSPAAAARSLMSKAQLAFDRGQYNEALALVGDAKKLNADSSAFGNGIMQPFQLELELQKKMGSATFDPSVKPAQNTELAGKVETAGYNPATDTTRNVAVSMNDDVNQLGSTANRLPATAIEQYRAGIDALRKGNRQEGKRYLEQAWNNRASLDPATQQSVQDQLLKLSAAKPNNNIALASQNQPIPDIQEQDLEAFRTLQKEVFRDRAAAERALEKSPREALEKMAMIRNRIGQSTLDAKQQRPLLTMIDRDIAEIQAYIEQNVSTIENDETNAMRKELVERRRQRRLDVQQQLQMLVEKYNNLVDEQRFGEAEMIASQAFDLAPDTDIAVLLKEKSLLLKRDAMNQQLRRAKEEGFWASMHNVEKSSTPYDETVPMQIGNKDEFARRANQRARRNEANRYNSESEARIWNILKNEKVQGELRGTLREAVAQLATSAGVTIIFDELALSEENVATDSQVELPITDPISLKSALTILLEQKGLVYIVEDEVIKVTSKESRATNLIQRTYYIGDLVMPMGELQGPYELEWMAPPRMLGAMGGSMNVQNANTNMPNSQLALAQQLGGQAGNPFGNMGAMNFGGYGDRSGPQTGTMPPFTKVGQKRIGGVTIGDFQPLMQLIRGTIATESWDSDQGQGTLFPYVQNLSLVVSNTQEVQDQIVDLLEKLRELNDVQIVVEVRFVTLQDNFFERVGVDFDFAINDSGNVNPNADTQQSSGVIGRAGVDPFSPTADGDIEFLQGSFSAAEPIFGGFSGGASAASIGFAILSDIEVFFLLQAAKGNTRTNVTQAPTVTMFNGQSANVTDAQQRPFVTAVVPVVGDFAVAHQPIITLLPDGTNLNVTAVVSSDRKYVRMQLVPFFSQVTEVNTFTFDGRQTTERTTNSVLDDLLDIVDGGNNADNDDEELQTTTQGITVQLPTLATTSIQTVVSVPDGGTVLMGGVKRMREGRNEAGIPFLANLPYVNRLFKNVGIGHETQHLMMMVTPRIIIQKEIEEDQVGLDDE